MPTIDRPHGLVRRGALAAIAAAIALGLPSEANDLLFPAADESNGDVPNELRLFEQMPLVITAARKPQRITEASSTIDVITAEDIRRSGALTLAELLERLPGVYTPTSHNALDMLWIRGVGGRYNDNALLLIDGIPYRTLYYSNFPINEQIPLEDIKRIEIIRGPGSALYGTSAFTGVINILTKTVLDMKGNEVSAGFGTWSTQSHYAFIGKEFENGEVSLFGKYYDSDGYRAGVDDEGLPSAHRRGADNNAYNLKFRYGNFDLNVRYSKFSLFDFTAVLDEDDEGGWQTREHILTQAGYRQELTPRLSLQVKAYVNYFKFDRTGAALEADEEEDEPVELVGGFVSVNESEQYGRVAGVDVVTTMRFSKNHTLLLGANYEHEDLDHAWSRIAEPPTAPFELTEWASGSGGDTPESIANDNVAVYLEDEYKIGGKVILTGGLRYDSFEASDSRVSPRVSVVFTPDAKTAAKIRYGEAFRAPTYQELYKRTDDREGEGNKDLKPQTIRTAELELSRFPSDNHHVNATIFYSEFDKFIKVIGDGDFENLDKREFYGLELGVNGALATNLSYFANYTLTAAEEADGREVDSVPEHMGNIGFTYRGLKHVEIIPHLRLVGARNRPFNYQVDVEKENRRDLLGGYVVLNLTLLSRNLPGRTTASLAIRNLLDEAYHTAGEQTEDYDIRQPGRRVLFSLSRKF